MGAVLFDIGSTLVTGPDLSPVTVVTRLLGLPDAEKARVADIIMCNAFEDASHLCNSLRPLTETPFCADQLARIWLDQQTAPEEIPGATEAVRHVKQSGFKVGLISDIWAPYYKGFLDSCPELASMVDYAGLSFREGVRKPSLVLLERALEALKETSAQTWMVGDTYSNDLAPAIELGMRTVWVLSRPEKEYPAMEGVLKGRLPRPDIIIDNVADMCKIDLKKLATSD